MQIIYILWLRQIKRYFRSRARIIGSLGQPLLLLLALGFGFGPIYQKAGGGNYIQFLAPGIISMGILFTAVFSGIEIIWDKQFGFLKETLVAPVSRLKIMIGRTFGGATVAFIQGLIIFLISILIGFRPESIVQLPLTFVFMVIISLIFTALGITIASKLEDMQSFPLIINFIIMPLFFLSGALFPLDQVPKSIKIISLANPLSYGVDSLRGTLTEVSHMGFLLNSAVLISTLMIIGVIGTYFFSKIEI